MKNLEPIDTQSLHNAEAGQLVTRFFEDFAKADLDPAHDPDFGGLYSGILALLPDYNAALDQVQASEETKNIVNADQVRDRQLQALRDSLKPFRNSDDAAERAAYAALSLLISEYKGVEDNGYEEETNRLNTLVQRLQSADYAAHTQDLGVEKFVARLAAANTAFNDVFAKRSHETVQKVVYDAKKLRRHLLAEYRRMADYVASSAAVKSDPYYKEVLKVLNNGRTYFATTVLARRNARPADNTPGSSQL